SGGARGGRRSTRPPSEPLDVVALVEDTHPMPPVGVRDPRVAPGGDEESCAVRRPAHERMSEAAKDHPFPTAAIGADLVDAAVEREREVRAVRRPRRGAARCEPPDAA